MNTRQLIEQIEKYLATNPGEHSALRFTLEASLKAAALSKEESNLAATKTIGKLTAKYLHFELFDGLQLIRQRTKEQTQWRINSHKEPNCWRLLTQEERKNVEKHYLTNQYTPDL